MLIVDGDYNFTETKAKAFCKWYLEATVANVVHEFEDANELTTFLEKRERRLKVQLDDLANLSFERAIPCSITNKPYFKLVKTAYQRPLSSVGALRASSRFNYKEHQKLATKSIYFGQTKQCCYAEKFHLDIQRYNYGQIVERNVEELANEFKFEPHELHEYEVNLDRVLVLTSEASYKAIGIPDRVVKDEWFSVNQDFDIPTAGQLLGRAAVQAGYQGVLYSSVRDQTTYNLVVFEERTGELDYKLLNKMALDPAALQKTI